MSNTPDTPTTERQLIPGLGYMTHAEFAAHLAAARRRNDRHWTVIILLFVVMGLATPILWVMK